MEQLWKKLNPNNNEIRIENKDAHQYKDNWKADVLGTSQRIFVDKELQQMKAGNMPEVYNAFVEILKAIPETGFSMIDLACSTGYYYEVAEYALPGKIKYYGSDYNPASIRLANELYPNVEFYEEDITDIKFEDKSFNISMVAGVLEHIPEQERAFDEFCRIANDYVICHRMKFVKGDEYFTKGSQYNVPVVRYYYNREQFLKRMKDRGFDLCAFIQIYPHTAECQSMLFKRGDSVFP